MIFLLFAFCLGLLSLFFFGKKKISAPSVSLPLPKAELTSSLPPPTPVGSSALQDLENDLNLIEADLKKIKEDTRLNPPEFIFDLTAED